MESIAATTTASVQLRSSNRTSALDSQLLAMLVNDLA